MLRLNNYHLRELKTAQSGFSLVELITTVTLVSIMAVFTYAAFNSSITQYFDLQKQGMHFTDLARQSHRLAGVVRGATDISVASNNELQLYSYFSPSDRFVSQVRYYLSDGNSKLLADVTPMTANPPIGSPITADRVTYTVLGNYQPQSGINLFTYLDAEGNVLNLPITDLTTIKGVRIQLAVPGADSSSNQAIDLQVSLRNRKTNL